MPGLIPRRSTGTRSGDQRWIGSRHALDSAKTGTVSVSTFTKATHYPDGYLKSGTPVNAADPSVLKPFTGGTGEVLRFLKDNHDIEAGINEVQVAYLWHGLIYTNRLPVALPDGTVASGGFTFETGA